MAVEFLLLGPLEVSRGGRPVPLGVPRQRTVLASLLLSANATVTLDRLVHDIWADDPPRTAVRQVQDQVSALRRLLGGEGEVTLRTEHAGYRLVIPPHLLDLKQFRQRTRQGRAALRSGRADEAAEHLRAALRLYRGPPLRDAAAPLAAAQAEAMDEQRLAALEDRVEAELAAWGHDLGALVAVNRPGFGGGIEPAGRWSSASTQEVPV